MSGWTPGPWRIPEHTFIGGHYVGTDAADICEMANWGYDLEAEQVANANLIAAAPDLFEALAMMIADFADYPASERPCLAFDKASAALAKARGETL